MEFDSSKNPHEFLFVHSSSAIKLGGSRLPTAGIFRHMHEKILPQYTKFPLRCGKWQRVLCIRFYDFIVACRPPSTADSILMDIFFIGKLWAIRCLSTRLNLCWPIFVPHAINKGNAMARPIYQQRPNPMNKPLHRNPIAWFTSNCCEPNRTMTSHIHTDTQPVAPSPIGAFRFRITDMWLFAPCFLTFEKFDLDNVLCSPQSVCESWSQNIIDSDSMAEA